jgi:hypothetical protein
MKNDRCGGAAGAGKRGAHARPSLVEGGKRAKKKTKSLCWKQRTY